MNTRIVYGKNISKSVRNLTNYCLDVKGLNYNKRQKPYANSPKRVKTRVFWKKTNNKNTCMYNDKKHNIESVVEKSNIQQKTYESTVLVSNRFDILSDLVDEGEYSHNNVASQKQKIECKHVIGVKNIEHSELSNEGEVQYSRTDVNSRGNTEDQKVNQKTLNISNSVEIVKAIKQGKAPACVRQVNVNRLQDKCVDLQKCIKQQKNPYGFLPISNLKRMRLAYNARPNVVLASEQFDPIEVHKQVRATGKYNYEEAKIQLPSQINFDLLAELSKDYWDYQLPLFLRFGFPLDFPKNKESHLKTAEENHASAVKYDKHIETYLDTERKLKAITGPYKNPPYGDLTQISPFMTRDKSDSVNRRVIIDLSWPAEASINYFTIPNMYLNTAYKLQYPTVDDITKALLEVENNPKMYKIDLSRAFRQLPIDPYDYNLLCLKWKREYYSDQFCPFGHRFGSLSCSRLSDFFRYLMWQEGHVIFNYVDDLIGIGPDSSVQVAYKKLLKILQDLNFPISDKKLVEPTTVCNCLGMILNTDKFTISVPEDKLAEIIQKCEKSMQCHTISKRDLQPLIGSLMFIHKAVRSSRYFVNRILQALRLADNGRIKVTEDMQRDLRWISEFVPKFNGTTTYKHNVIPCHNTLEIDACLDKVGGVWMDYVYSAEIPQSFKEKGLSITHFEMLNILVAIKMWGNKWIGQKVKLKTDNMAVVQVCNTGHTRDMELACYIRNIWFLTSVQDIELIVEHIPGKLNSTADLLSRWSNSKKCQDSLKALVKNPTWCDVTDECFQLNYVI